MNNKREVKLARDQLGIPKLRDHQREAINYILEGNDTFVLAPTSAGKSADYQIPALIFDGMTIVIEPTISLIYDQNQRLRMNGIASGYIIYNTSSMEWEYTMKMLQQRRLKFLFVTPERLQNENFKDLISNIKISMVVIDEAHCITSWGYAFRPDYLKIASFINSLPERPIVVALTATASPKARVEICDNLSMHNPRFFIQSLDRPNLHFIKKVFVSDKAKLKALKKLLNKHENGSCIVYCNTRKMTNKIYEKIDAWYPGTVAKCHSALDKIYRKQNEMEFLNGTKKIMVATSAFGMGIDQSEVDLIIHFNLSMSIADYYQQAGRAGRKGQKSKCNLLYCADDYFKNQCMLQDIENDNAREEAFIELDKIKEYAESSDCLTKQILYALGEEGSKPCGSCTNCQAAKKKK